MSDIISMETFFPGYGWEIPNDYKVLSHRDHIMIVEDPNGYRIKITGHAVPGAVVNGAVQSRLSSHPIWRSSDPECQHRESFFSGHPENPMTVPLCIKMRVHALHGTRSWQHVTPYKKRLASAASDELSKRKR
jgi:hypothetical protein